MFDDVSGCREIRDDFEYIFGEGLNLIRENLVASRFAEGTVLVWSATKSAMLGPSVWLVFAALPLLSLSHHHGGL